MKKIFKRIGSIIVVLTLCLSMTCTAFAAEQTTMQDSSEVSVNSVAACLYSNSKTFTTSTTFTITTSEANWDADFLLAVSGNSSATYTVQLVAANGNTYTGEVYGNGTGIFFNIPYAKAGTYTFSYTLKYGSPTSVAGIAQIHD